MNASAGVSTLSEKPDTTQPRKAKIVAAAQVVSIDYGTIVANAVAALVQNTPSARREVYSQARATVGRHLQLMRLPDPIVELEKLALDLAIKKIEDEARAEQSIAERGAEAPTAPVNDKASEAAASLARAFASRGRALVSVVVPGVRAVRFILSILAFPLRLAFRSLFSKVGLVAVLPIAAAAILVVYFADNRAAYRTLSESLLVQWLSHRDLAETAAPVAIKLPDRNVARLEPPKAADDAPPALPSNVTPLRTGAENTPIAPDATLAVPPADAPAGMRPCAEIQDVGERIACTVRERNEAAATRMPSTAATAPAAEARAGVTVAPAVALPDNAPRSPDAPVAPPAWKPNLPANSRVGALIESGRRWVLRDEIEHALHDFAEAIRLDPKYPDSYSERGQALFKMGETERSIADYSTAIKLDPRHAAALRARGMAYLYRGSPDLALVDISKAIQVAESEPGRLPPIELFYARRSRGAIYGSKQQYDLEIADCTTIINSYFNDPAVAHALREVYHDVAAANIIATIYRQRGTAYIRQSKWDLAAADLTAAIPLSSDRGFSALLDRAKLNEALGRREQAVADLQQALGLRPGSEEVRLSLRRLGTAPNPVTPSPI